MRKFVDEFAYSNYFISTFWLQYKHTYMYILNFAPKWCYHIFTDTFVISQYYLNILKIVWRSFLLRHFWHKYDSKDLLLEWIVQKWKEIFMEGMRIWLVVFDRLDTIVKLRTRIGQMCYIYKQSNVTLSDGERQRALPFLSSP